MSVRRDDSAAGTVDPSLGWLELGSPTQQLALLALPCVLVALSATLTLVHHWRWGLLCLALVAVVSALLCPWRRAQVESLPCGLSLDSAGTLRLHYADGRSCGVALRSGMLLAPRLLVLPLQREDGTRLTVLSPMPPTAESWRRWRLHLRRRWDDARAAPTPGTG
ncbi:hypothetical protein [Acidithiobacillus caldus]|jgi:hypothetical protein|uniref:hypothetical protein n=1 Tax=Acidithiobacillus caldus TaxID=33059 RepID=UPI00129BD352|nr:hypothetical protein [Acidithiobacillus caldus]MBU2728445.1 hypothetical protein [Acidithiobacillus caldus]MBU2737126.1 hypothetical protein [Acidithiobacillus caldus ATCC 51756]MBU2744865.1 hypothetical protein [Acidithiobacillus caldus]MBU2778861.1 hypothetical protein [Acidithiobacillus caldus]